VSFILELTELRRRINETKSEQEKGQIKKMSSMYLFHKRGFCGEREIAFISQKCM
jgi:hypothetical protein